MIITLVPVPGATVSSIDNDGQEVIWLPVGDEREYLAPENWIARAGKSYYIRVVTAQGEVVESVPEPVPSSVPIKDLRVRFEQEAYFSDNRERFIPAFTVLASQQDPADEPNFDQRRDVPVAGRG